MGKNLVGFNDVESRAGVNSQAVLGMPSTESNSGWSWTHHAQQWLKGGVAVLGTAVFGGLTYLVGKNFAGKTNENLAGVENSDVGSSGSSLNSTSSITMTNVGTIARSIPATTTIFSGRELLSLTETESVPAQKQSAAVQSQLIAKVDSVTQKANQNKLTGDLSLDYPGSSSKNSDVSSKQRREVLGEFRVNTYVNGGQQYHSIAGFSGGGFVAAWYSSSQDPDASGGIYGQLYDATGAAQGGEFRVNTYTVGSQDSANIVTLTGGGFVVVWTSCGQAITNCEIYGQRYNASAVKQGGEFKANTYSLSTALFPVVGSLSDGGFVITWSSDGQDGNGFGIYGQRYDSSGVKQGGEFRVNTYTTGSQLYSAVTGLTGGGFVVAWQSYDNDGNGIYAQRYNASGVAQGAEFRVNTYTIGEQSNPSIKGLTAGGFVVAWSGKGLDSGSNIYGQRYDASGVAQGGEFLINTCTTITQEYPSITALTDGGFVVVWQNYGQDGDADGVYGQRYIYNGTIRDGSEFRVNTYTTNRQNKPSVAPLAGGGFVVAWASFFQDGNGYGVYGQIFAGTITISSNYFSLNEGQELLLTTAMLSMQDSYNNDDTRLSFIISDVQHGQFELLGNRGTSALTFTQKEITTGKVFFVHDGGEVAPAFRVSASNGPYYTAPITGSIVFANVNDAPILNGTAIPVLTAINEDITEPSGNTVATIIVSGSITDPDGIAVQAIAITEVDNTNGIWQYTTDGSLWKPIAPISDTQSLMLDTNNKVRFIPNANFNGEATFTFRAWDESIGIAGAKADTTVNGGTSAFSTATNTATIAVNPLNDAPVLNGSVTPVLTAITINRTSPNGNSVSSIIPDGAITDVDGVVKAIAITSVDNSNGSWEYSLDGVNWNAVGLVSSTNSLLLDANNKIRFIPDVFYTNGNASFTFRAWDKSSGSAGEKVDTSVNGGASAFSAETGSASVSVLNNAPVLNTGAAPTLSSVMEDAVNSVGNRVDGIVVNSSITDLDTGGTEVKAIAIAEVDNSNGIWQYTTDGTLWKPIAPVSDTQSLLLDDSNKVRFIPNSEFNGDATFTFRAWDKSIGIAGAKADTTVNGGTSAFSTATNTATIAVNSLNDAPVLNGSVTPVLTVVTTNRTSPNGNSISSIIPEGAITDVDGVVKAIAITSVDNSNGSWEYSLDGVNWNAAGSISSTNSLLLDANNKIRFIPDVFYTNGNASFTFRAWDKSSGSVGEKVDASVNGGTSAFSAETGTASISVLNNAPVLNTGTAPTLSSVMEDAVNPVGNRVDGIVANSSITDLDTGGTEVKAIAITEVDNTNGLWQYTTDGTLWKPVAPVSDTQSLLLDASNKVRFISNSEFNGDATFTFRAWDKSVGAAGTKVDTNSNGGATAYSTTTNIAAITVNPVNDSPLLVNSELTINQGKTIILTNQMLSATDIDNDNSLLTFLVSDVKHGRFELISNPGQAINSFTQQQITDKQVQFVHNNDSEAPSYNVAVSDGSLVTTSLPAKIQFTPTPATVKTESGNNTQTTIKNAIIGAGVSGGVGLMFLVLKIYLGHKATQKLEKNAQAYKDSVQKKQEEFERNVLQPVAKKIRDEIKITGFMGYISDSAAKDYVAAIVKVVRELNHEGINIDLSSMDSIEQSTLLTEVAKQTRHLLVPKHGMCSCAPVITFFKPEVKPEDIHKNARTIAKEVKKALTRQDTQVSLRTSVELNDINQGAEDDYITPPNV